MESAKTIGKILLGLAVIGIMALYFKHLDARDQVELQKFSKCVDVVGQVIPDANDLEARASFLKNCYEGN